MATNRTDALLIARRYATAIFSVALDAKQEAAVVEEFTTLANAITQAPALSAALASPLVSRAEKATILSRIMEKGSKTTLQALDTLASGGRADLIPDVAALLRKQLSAHRGELVAVVTAARRLAPEVEKQLKTALATATGKEVEIQVTQDPSVLGGLAVQLGSLRLDATLAGALNTMRTQITASANAQS